MHMRWEFVDSIKPGLLTVTLVAVTTGGYMYSTVSLALGCRVGGCHLSTCTCVVAVVSYVLLAKRMRKLPIQIQRSFEGSLNRKLAMRVRVAATTTAVTMQFGWF